MENGLMYTVQNPMQLLMFCYCVMLLHVCHKWNIYLYWQIRRHHASTNVGHLRRLLGARRTATQRWWSPGKSRCSLIIPTVQLPWPSLIDHRQSSHSARPTSCTRLLTATPTTPPVSLTLSFKVICIFRSWLTIWGWWWLEERWLWVEFLMKVSKW